MLKVLKFGGSSMADAQQYEKIKSIVEAAGRKAGVIGTNGAVIDGVRYETKNTTPESYELQ